jgi:predicted dehydrogenase
MAKARARPFNVAIIGTGFMGRAHSQAWASVGRFFDLPRTIVMKTVCGRDTGRTREFARRWVWADSTNDVACVFEDREIDLVDVLTPNHLHAEQAIAALERGRHVACEKPLAGTLEDARAMRDAARQHRSLRTFVWFNYRRCPAVAFAHQLVKRGRLGRIFHVRAHYLQEWGTSATPLSWRFQGDLAGSGAHGDLNAHIIDMMRFITGEEITEVSGAIEETFIEKRKTPGGAGTRAKSAVDDCVLFLARFSGGAVASFEVTRLATGNYNRNGFEINGEKGAIRFDFERMNELQWWDATLEPGLRGWSSINCSVSGAHPYSDAYWPSGHAIGYEHTFISQAADIVRVLSGKKPVVALPDFEDAYQTQRVLEAALVSARERRAVKINEVK